MVGFLGAVFAGAFFGTACAAGTDDTTGFGSGANVFTVDSAGEDEVADDFAADD